MYGDAAARWLQLQPALCGGIECPYGIETACGSESVSGSCDPRLGWTYDVACPTDCTAHTTSESCSADLACAWLASCDGTSQCVRTVECTPGDMDACPEGQTCAEKLKDYCEGAVKPACTPECTLPVYLCVLD